jgi:hypothetical protein
MKNTYTGHRDSDSMLRNTGVEIVWEELGKRGFSTTKSVVKVDT